VKERVSRCLPMSDESQDDPAIFHCRERFVALISRKFKKNLWGFGPAPQEYSRSANLRDFTRRVRNLFRRIQLDERLLKLATIRCLS
jgi:hypothetical protein